MCCTVDRNDFPPDRQADRQRASDRPAAPTVTNKDGSFNFSYFTQLGGYYEKHFAFRPEMIQADAMIQSKGFFTSNINTVLVGNNDWLYYTSSTDDYLGKNTLSDKEINGVLRIKRRSFPVYGRAEQEHALSR